MEFSLRHFDASDAAWLTKQHADHHAQAEGFDETFGPLVASIIDDFLNAHNPHCESGWVAHHGAKRLGSIFCIRVDEMTAKLRLFYVVPEARGTGVAQALLTECLEFARCSGYRCMTLWTHESHRAAGAIYARNGFVRTHAKPVRSFGVDLVEETWEIQF